MTSLPFQLRVGQSNEEGQTSHSDAKSHIAGNDSTEKQSFDPSASISSNMVNISILNGIDDGYTGSTSSNGAGRKHARTPLVDTSSSNSSLPCALIDVRYKTPRTVSINQMGNISKEITLLGKKSSVNVNLLAKTNENQHSKTSQPGNNALHSSWSILERSLKSKIGCKQNVKKKRRQEQGQELCRNFDTALKDFLVRSLPPPKTIPLTNTKVETMPLSSLCDMDWMQSMSTVNNTPIYNVGVDMMSNIMRYLDPTEVHYSLTLPLSKTWRRNFTTPQNLWKVLCLSEPFFVKLEDHGNGSSDISLSSFPICNTLEVQHLVGRYHLLYISFVKCARYLERIKDDAVNGRTPPGINDISNEINKHTFHKNASLQGFFAKASEGVVKGRNYENHSKPASSKMSKQINTESLEKNTKSYACVDDISQSRSYENDSKKSTTVTYGHSKLTQKLFLGSATRLSGVPGYVDLPWSCAMYSVVNWMVAFTDVMGIQIMCLKVLPFLLEDEKQRTTAQRAGLTDVVLRSMVLFPDNVILHTAAFHTLVLLARPLGGKEGMLFHSAMVKSSGIFNDGSSTGKSGIAVMLDSMKRFANDEILQAMSCWSMVNIALIPSQKAVLVKLGGISAAANAMMQHPLNAEVQFRALFALINLVIPSEKNYITIAEDSSTSDQLNETNNNSDSDVLDDEIVLLIANLVVVGMKNFCSSEAILNRACLVLHNLSLNEEYHRTLLQTPNCYQMLEWCIGNYKNDNVLQQSAGGTLLRLRMSLTNDNNLRYIFEDSIRTQQQGSPD